MSMKLVERLQYCMDESNLQYPRWMFPNLQYLTITGSVAYGISSNTSDLDLMGITIEPKACIFPNLVGNIYKFDQCDSFENFNRTGIIDKDKSRNYDVSIYGLVRAFTLMEEGNPNMVEMLFTPRECVLHSTPLAEKIRLNRELFLSKRFAMKCKSYGFSQLQKLDRTPIGKRLQTVQKYGWDTKYQSHVYRLILNAEQILETGELDLQKNAELLKYIKEGNVTPDESKKWFNDKERYIDKLDKESNLRSKPHHPSIKALLLDIIETHYGKIFDEKPAVDSKNAISRDVIDRMIEFLQKL